MKRFLLHCCFLLVSIQTIQAQLTDFQGKTVYIFLLEDCVISQHYAPILNELHQTYVSDSMRFIGIFPNRFSTPQTIDLFKTTYAVPFELKYEYYQQTARKLAVTVTPEVVIYDEQKDRILYKGRIDDQFVRVGRRRQVRRTFELEAALKALQNGEEIVVKKTTAIGCFIKYEN